MPLNKLILVSIINNMNKTFRASSLPHLKPILTASFKHLIDPALKSERGNKTEPTF
jgi:hypothetical protein